MSSIAWFCPKLSKNRSWGKEASTDLKAEPPTDLSPQINPGESHTDGEQVFFECPIQHAVFWGS